MPASVRWGAVCGLVASLPVWAGILRLWAAGWTPVGDEAVIAWRSWDVFTGHGPLVGQFTQASGQSSHAVFDPGPLLYWALALPTRLAPGVGPLLGVALVDTVALVAACVAVCQLRGRFVAVVAAAGAVTGWWTLMDFLLGVPVWNPYCTLVPFGALLLVAWVVASGRLGWCPVVLVLASYCTQAHLMFAPASVGVTAVALVLGLVTRRRRHLPVGWRWAAAATGALVACWAVPLWQQFTHRPGNLTLLWRSVLDRSGSSLGWHQALTAFGAATLPQPIWLRAPRFDSPFVAGGDQGSAAVGIAVLAALGAVAVWAAWRSHPRTLGLAAVALVSGLGCCWALAGIATAQAASALYIQYALWPAGMLAVLALAYPIVTSAYPWARDRVAVLRGRHRGPLLLRHARQRARLRLGAGAVLLAGALAVSGVAVANAPTAARLGEGGQQRLIATTADALVERVGTPPRPGERIAVRVDSSYGFVGASIASAAAYQLERRGWTPSIAAPWDEVLIARFHRRASDPSVWLQQESPRTDAVPVLDLQTPTDRGARPATVWLDPRLAGGPTSG